MNFGVRFKAPTNNYISRRSSSNNNNTKYIWWKKQQCTPFVMLPIFPSVLCVCTTIPFASWLLLLNSILCQLIDSIEMSGKNRSKKANLMRNRYTLDGSGKRHTHSMILQSHKEWNGRKKNDSGSTITWALLFNCCCLVLHTQMNFQLPIWNEQLAYYHITLLLFCYTHSILMHTNFHPIFFPFYFKR